MPPWICPFTSMRVDHAPDVVDHRVAHHAHRAGLRVDLDLADVAAVGERDRGRRERGRLAEARLQPGRELARLVGGAGDARPSATPRSVPATDEAAVAQRDVLGRGLEQVRGDAAAALDRPSRWRAAPPSRPR